MAVMTAKKLVEKAAEHATAPRGEESIIKVSPIQV